MALALPARSGFRWIRSMVWLAMVRAGGLVGLLFIGFTSLRLRGPVGLGPRVAYSPP